MNYRKIAEIAGVSPSTVSKALTGSTEISAEISAQIQRIAIEEGYFKEKKKRQREYSGNGEINIAVIIPEIYGSHYGSITNMIKNEVESRGGNIAIYVNDYDKKKSDDILRSLIIGGVTDGVIMYSKSPDFSNPDFPIVAVNEDPVGDYDVICYGVSGIIYDALSYLKNLGHRKIGFVGDRLTRSKARNFKRIAEALGLCCTDDFFLVTEKRYEMAGSEAARHFSTLTEKPTAILCAYDEIALSLIHEFSLKGIRVPEDISVMGINNIPAAAYAGVPLTTVEEDKESGFCAAVELLFDKIINETKEIKSVSMSHRIITRSSVKKLG